MKQGKGGIFILLFILLLWMPFPYYLSAIYKYVTQKRCKQHGMEEMGNPL